MITTNENNKVPKLTIEVPEYDSPDSFPLIFATRFSLARLSPTSQTPKHAKTKGNFKFNRSAGNTPTSRSPVNNKHHEIPFVFIMNPNDLTIQGSIPYETLEPSEEDQLKTQKYNKIYKDHLYQTYQSLKFIKELRPVDLQQLKAKRVTIPKRKGYEFKKTVIFDLDETLVHCCEDDRTIPNIILPIKFPNGDITEVGICIRPYALECLKQVSKNYEIIIFTASHQSYADTILDYLDPEGDIIHHRFYRQHCVLMDGVYIKDLRIFANRKIKDMIIVDNFAHSFAYQLDNGIPIISWVDYEHDQELYGLMYYLKKLVKVQDVRETNKKFFRLSAFVDEFTRETTRQSFENISYSI
jgi:Dullard-like phosphatase family protein